MQMHKSLAKVLIGILIHIATFPGPASAGSAVEKRGEQVKAAVARMEVGRDTLVSVQLRNNTTVVGYLAAVNEHSFLITDPQGNISTQIAYRNVTQLNAMSTRAKLAVTAMAILVLWIVLCPSTTNARCGIGGS